MSSTGWLDIHGHFALPLTPEEKAETLKAYHSLHFMATDIPDWDVDAIIQYLDRAGVQLQMLSYIPHSHAALRTANSYGLAIVQKYPKRFGLLAALPTDSAAACLQEIERTDRFPIRPDGFAVHTTYNGVMLSDPLLEPVWGLLNERKAVVFIHPDTTAPSILSHPTPLIDVAFDTTRTVVDMLYAGLFRRHPSITFVLSHCGGALPVLAGRLSLLGTESWVPNPQGLGREEIEGQLGRLWVDTAAMAKTGLRPAMAMVGAGRCVYGADCGVLCSREETMEENRGDVVRVEKEEGLREGSIGRNGWGLFPGAVARVGGIQGD